MTIKEAAERRHMVRRYTGRKIPKDIVERLTARIDEGNKKYNLKMKLVLENTEALGAAVKLFLAKGVRNYIILAGEDTPNIDEKLGYCGADVMLLAQTLGLNSWWVGGTFSRIGAKKNADVAASEKVAGIIAVGYGANQGTPHKSKKPEEVSRYSGTAPAWFIKGVEAAMLAPTALNKQAFLIKGGGSKVSVACGNGKYSGVELGIVKYHFEVGAGKENFEWA